MSRTVYGLFYVDSKADTGKRYFYVGRSVDMFRREKQHNYAKAKGHEDKYEFIRQLETLGITWHIGSLREIPNDEYPPDNERWFVIKLTRDGHTLMNMRHGSVEHRRELAEQIQTVNIRNVSDVREDRMRRKYAASRRLKRRLLESALTREGIPNIGDDRLLPPVLRKRLLALNWRPIPPRMALSEVISLARATPKLLRLLAS